MKALISPDQKVYSYTGALIGERVAEVSAADFPVAPPLFWVDCSDQVVADQWYYDPSNGDILLAPQGPTISAKFTPNPVFIGLETVLSWNVSGATSVMLGSYGSQQFPVSGSIGFTYGNAGPHEEVLTAVAVDGNLARPIKVTVVATQAELVSSANPPITVI